MSYRRKTQHDSVVPIQQKERERGKSIDENSINVFALLVGGTASVEKTLAQSPKSISVVNTHGSQEIEFTLTASSMMITSLSSSYLIISFFIIKRIIKKC